MIGHYLSILIRLFAARGVHTAITLLGLAVGVASCIMISLYVRYELSFEDQFAKADRIYRISRGYNPTEGVPARVPASNNAPVAPALLQDFPQVEKTTRVYGGRSLLEHEDKAFFESGFRFADASFFEIFDFEWLAGDPAVELRNPDWIVLTGSLARKYFGNTDPRGQTVTWENQIPLRVAGVIRDVPDNTHLDFDAVASLDALAGRIGPRFLSAWNSSTDFHTYFLLKQGADVEAVRSGMPAFLDRHAGENASKRSDMAIMSIADIHLRSQRDEEWKPPGNRSTIYGFTAIALLILFIACVNFVNLATASASSRATEVGVRKSLGATRPGLIAQFLAEAILTVAVATFLAMCIVELLMPAFSAFVGADLRVEYLGPRGIALALVGAVLLVGVLAGSYPAFYLSAFEPARVLKGDVTGGTAGAALSRVLVMLQFSIAIALIVGAVIVFQQMRFARNIDLGFNKDQIVILSGSGSGGLGTQWNAIKERLLTQSGVQSVTASHYPPFSFNDNRLRVRTKGSGTPTRIQYMAVDHDFFDTYEIDIVAGRAFSRDFPSDVTVMPGRDKPVSPSAFVLNEAAARQLGLSATEAAGGSVFLDIGLDDTFAMRLEGPVLGVARDTYFESVEVALRPMIYLLYTAPSGGGQPLNFGAIRVSAQNLPATLAHIDATWHTFMPEYPVNRHFLSRDFEALYQSVDRQATLVTVFSALAIVVACVGLFGLASLTTEQRTKEIGVRKALGGSVTDIVRLFCREFGSLVVAANVVAWPVAYLLVRRWLDHFVYRIDVNPLVFVVSAAFTLVLALVTVGLVAARAANADPVHALRHE